MAETYNNAPDGKDDAPEKKVDKKDEKSSESASKYKSLVAQVKAEYHLGWSNQEPKKKEAELRLKLYNNQKRDKKAVGDNTLFTVLQTVVAGLYNDRLIPGFGGREEGDDEQTENLDSMAEFDYDEMAKDRLDYDWIWDAGFHGYGLVSMEDYVRDPENNRFYPIPYVLDPLTFVRDPRATSINGQPDNKKGAARFFGYPCKMSEYEMKENPYIFEDLVYSEINHVSTITTDNRLQSAQDSRDDAQGRQPDAKQNSEKALGANAQYDVLVWYTFYEIDNKPQRVKCWLTNGGSKLIGVQKLKQDYWQIIYRPLFPTAHDFDGVSIPDLVEDKQRARAVIANLGLNALRAEIMPMYIYDSNKITNKNDLKFAFNKFLPMDAKGQAVGDAIQPLNKARFNMQLVDFIYSALDISAQKSTATPDIEQGIQSEKNRPLGETNLIKTGVDTRRGLAAAVFGWSEKEFWQQWYAMYFEYFADDIDTKVLRLVGSFGAKWRPLDKKDFITRINPDVKIESKEVNRARQLEERQGLVQYFSLVLQEPTANRRYALKKLGRSFLLKKDELDRILPPTIDERIAEDENEKLNEDKFVGVMREDDHNVHLEVHAKARETDSAVAHIETHKRALSIKKTNPDFFPEEEQATEFAPVEGGQALPGGRKPTPQPNPKPIAPSQTSATSPGLPA